MISAAFDLLEFLNSNFALLFALALYTALAVVLSKSIKKHDKVYYWIFGVISFCFIIPSVARLVGVTLPFNFGDLPIIGLSSRELSSAANFIHPVLIIIMYMGALDIKIPFVGKLMSIRKELSIIVGFPLLAHAMKRVFGSFPSGWQFFFDNETYMQSPRVSSALGSGITSFAFVLGIVMLVLFLVLWITSFDSVHRKLGTKRWKSIQKWSYGLYAMLFIHAMCLQVGGLVSDYARSQQQSQQQPRVEVVADAPQQGHGQQASQGGQQQGQQGHGQQASQGGQQQGQQGQQQQASQGHGHGPSSFQFTDIEISRTAKRYINIFVLLAIYGSYLVLRLRKAKEAKLKKAAFKK